MECIHICGGSALWRLLVCNLAQRVSHLARQRLLHPFNALRILNVLLRAEPSSRTEAQRSDWYTCAQEFANEDGHCMESNLRLINDIFSGSRIVEDHAKGTGTRCAAQSSTDVPAPWCS